MEAFVKMLTKLEFNERRHVTLLKAADCTFTMISDIKSGVTLDPFIRRTLTVNKSLF
jgi:hypothetical protein